jgi:TPR repeat protein
MNKPIKLGKLEEWPPGLVRQAAQQGVGPAQTFLAERYRDGDGVPQDYAESYAWFSVAAKSGDEMAIQARDEVKTKIDPKLLGQAESLAAEYTKRFGRGKSAPVGNKSAPALPDLGKLPELNLPANSSVDSVPKKQPSVGENKAVHDQPSRPAKDAFDSMMEKMKRASAVDEETPQGQYNLASKLISDIVQLQSQGGAERKEIEKLMIAAAKWRKNSALQGYLPAMTLIGAHARELGRKEILMWRLVNLHGDMLVKRVNGASADPQPGRYSAIGLSARYLDPSEVSEAVQEAENQIDRFTTEGYLPSATRKLYGDTDLQLWKGIKSNCIKHGNLPEDTIASFAVSDSEQTDETGSTSALAITATMPVSPSGHIASQKIEFGLLVTNISKETIPVPEKDFGGSKRNVLGTIQCWIERLGPATEIPAISKRTGRRGNHYAAGGLPIVCRKAALGPGDNEIEIRKLDTTGYPSGQYHYHIELRPQDSSLPRATAVVQFSIE